MALQGFFPPISIKLIAICMLWYFTSFVTLQLLKIILVRFLYPLFLSSAQFMLGSTLSWLLLQFSNKAAILGSKYAPNTVQSRSPIFSTAVFLQVLPLGLFQFTGKYFLLNATLLILLATVLSIKALLPLFVIAGYRIFYGVRLPTVTYLLLAPLLLGVLIIVSAESPKHLNTSQVENPTSEANMGPAFITRFWNELSSTEMHQMKGLICCLVSTVIFAGQNIYLKQLVTAKTSSPASLLLNTGRRDSVTKKWTSTDSKLPISSEDINSERTQHKKHMRGMPEITSQTNQKPDKITIIFYISMIGFIFSFIGFLAHEFPTIVHNFNYTEENKDESIVDTTTEALEVMVLVTVDSLSHFAQTIFSFYLLGLIPALLYSIALLIKRVFLIAISIIVVAGQHLQRWGLVTKQHIGGLALISVGLYSYDRWGSTVVRGK